MYKITTEIKVLNGEIERFPIAFEQTELNINNFASWVSWDNWLKNNLTENEVLPEHSGLPSLYEGCFSVDSIERVNEMDVEFKEKI